MAVLKIGNVVFEWDDEKANSNLSKHGISFLEAATVFRDPLGILKQDIDHSIGEDRFLLIDFVRHIEKERGNGKGPCLLCIGRGLFSGMV
jgi:hypothetical protein